MSLADRLTRLAESAKRIALGSMVNVEVVNLKSGLKRRVAFGRLDKWRIRLKWIRREEPERGSGCLIFGSAVEFLNRPLAAMAIAFLKKELEEPRSFLHKFYLK
ncbi:hypothetical protein K0M31_013997 [Melipona bicolor]|uniref:Uncharacterized protein n=1 Tax=Melipona bicolor TaxID=60889 RepID=A0AA40G7Q6_9HYME|nr:hypothetical protein K0M31_013997 [Melipona bicolor]